MAPGAKSADLLYLSDEQADDVYVYSWPGGKLMGTLTGFDGPQGECVDKAGDVFIANEYTYQVLEYAHGGTTPIATLSYPGIYPVGCSVDPTTGNLAVTNIDTPTGGIGNVLIYPDATGTPTSYTAPRLYYYFFCSYDARGNLFVDGTNGGSTFALDELAKSNTTFVNVTLDQTINYPGGVQWDGKYLAIGDQAAPYIYEFKISAGSGTEVGTTPIDDADNPVQFWKQGREVVVPDFSSSEVQLFDYPAGGMAKKTFTGFSAPFGSVVSKSN